MAPLVNVLAQAEGAAICVCEFQESLRLKPGGSGMIVRNGDRSDA